MRTWVRGPLWTGELGQDLIEYTLLLGFICVASVAIFVVNGGSIAGIWSMTNAIIGKGNAIATTVS